MATALVVPTFSVVDEVVSLYGSLDYIGAFLVANPIVDGVNQDMDLLAGSQLNYTPLTTPIPTALLTLIVQPGQVTTGTVYGAFGISIYDMTLQSYGTLDWLGAFMTGNSIDGIDDPNIDRPMAYPIGLVQQPLRNANNANQNIIYATLWQPSEQEGWLQTEQAPSLFAPPFITLENLEPIVVNIN